MPFTCSLFVIKVMLTAWNFGATEVLEPGLILLLAWGLGDVISDLHTAKYIASALEVNQQYCFFKSDSSALQFTRIRFLAHCDFAFLAIGRCLGTWVSCVDGPAGSTAVIDGGRICYRERNGDYGWFLVNWLNLDCCPTSCISGLCARGCALVFFTISCVTLAA